MTIQIIITITKTTIKMNELIKKIALAKAEIKNTKLKKEGTNTFSKYDYFTPSQIELLVATACQNNKLLTTFDLIRDDLGVYGKLTIYDTESGEKMETVMATAIPEIKATNIAQQLGGCVTYTERYLKMSFFGITDNKLDFDTTENTKKTETIEDAIKAFEKVSDRKSFEAAMIKYSVFMKDEKILSLCKELADKFPKA
ncbi:MAG: ERF family protein [Culicoidibacterales bacterium]